jgi:hypothetical protein
VLAPSLRLVVLALLPSLEYLRLTLPKAVRKRKVGRSDSVRSKAVERFQFRRLRVNLRYMSINCEVVTICRDRNRNPCIAMCSFNARNFCRRY